MDTLDFLLRMVPYLNIGVLFGCWGEILMERHFAEAWKRNAEAAVEIATQALARK